MKLLIAVILLAIVRQEINCQLTDEEEEIVAKFLEKHKVRIEKDEHRTKAAGNILNATLKVTTHNQLYDLGLVNFKTAVYPFHYLSKEKIHKMKMGALPPIVKDPNASSASNSSSSNSSSSESYDSNSSTDSSTSSSSVESNNERRKRALPQVKANATDCGILPDSFSWVDQGKVTPIQNQQMCGCCYVFSSVAAMESATAILYATVPIKLSEQYFLECLSSGCNGGHPSYVWNTTKYDGGAVAAASYIPYNGISSGLCNLGLPSLANTVVDHWVDSPAGDEETLKCLLVTQGPLTVAMDFHGSINHYKEGIFDDPLQECSTENVTVGNYIQYTKPPNHSLLLVGYGTNVSNTGDVIDYWLIKNSWGENWGENGYIRVARNKGNICHVASIPQYPVLISSGLLPDLLNPVLFTLFSDANPEAANNKRDVQEDIYTYFESDAVE